MSPDELCEIGEQLHGNRWQRALARTLNVNERTVRRWASGETVIPPTVEAELFAIAAGCQALNPRVENALAIMSEWGNDWGAIRDGKVVHIIHKGQRVGVAIWQQGRIVGPRLVIDNETLALLEQSVQHAIDSNRH